MKSSLTKLIIVLGMIVPSPSIIGTLVWKATPFIQIYALRKQSFKFFYAFILIMCILYAAFSLLIGRAEIISSIGISVSAVLVVLSHAQGRSFISKPALTQLLLLVGFLYIIYMFIDSNFLRTRNDGRLHLFHIDPNFSSVILYGTYALLRSKAFKWAPLFILIMGFFLQSRAFIVAILIFEIFKFFPIIKTVRVSSPILLSSLLVILMSGYVSNALGGFTYEENGFRLIDWADNSNIGRFQKFASAVQMLRNGDLTFHGIDISIFGAIVPHNTALYTIASFGLVQSSLFLFLLFGVKAKSINAVSFVFGYVAFSTFLHGLFLGYFLCFFLFILNEIKCHDINSNTA